jgi:hypothetical protein
MRSLKNLAIRNQSEKIMSRLQTNKAYTFILEVNLMIKSCYAFLHFIFLLFLYFCYVRGSVCEQHSKMKYLIFAARTTPSLFRNNFGGEEYIDTTSENGVIGL